MAKSQQPEITRAPALPNNTPYCADTQVGREKEHIIVFKPLCQVSNVICKCRIDVLEDGREKRKR